MSKKLIAVTPLWDETQEHLWMRPTYLDAIRDAGGIPVILPLPADTEAVMQLIDICDGLLLTGGPDIAPSLYGEETRAACGSICPDRDALEQAVYQRAILQNKAILGICRGIQAMNVFEGGTLYQDLPTEFPSNLEHYGQPPYDQVLHYVQVQSHLRNLLGMERLGVNSYHHQAIHTLGNALEVMAVADDGVVEAVCHTQKSFVWGVQWHPEFSFRTAESSRKIFKAFVDAC